VEGEEPLVVGTAMEKDLQTQIRTVCKGARTGFHKRGDGVGTTSRVLSSEVFHERQD